MDFGNIWIKWINALVFSSSLSILVNRSSTEDFKVFKDLRQGDTLCPFLFLVAAEGMANMVQKVSSLCELICFQVNDSIHFDFLQFVDDTIILYEPSWNNLWSLKGILRGFEFVYRFCINFVNSKLIGINIDEDFIQAASLFMSCSLGSVPFSFLGIQIGVNLRRKEARFLVLTKLHKRLLLWCDLGKNHFDQF